MTVTKLEELRVEPYGIVGWEQCAGVAHFATDPGSVLNHGIVDLDRAPLGHDGRVHFNADFRIIRPADDKPIERLLFVVPNRGFAGGMPFSLGAMGFAGSADAIVAGDALPLQCGWAVAWCGWQWDIVTPTSLALRAPSALSASGEPITGWLRVEFRTEAPQAHKHLSDSSPMFSFAPYPTADLDDLDAVLSVRDYLADTRVVIPRDRWRFARDDGGRPVADPAHIWLEGGFEPHRIDEVVYRTNHCPVTGAGLLAVRDFVSHLRYEASPEPIAHVLGMGVSQCGRFLRQFLYEGRNCDESGRAVFDGVFADIAGGRRGEFNHRYAQPSVTHTASFGNLAPFDNASLTAHQRAAGHMPKTVFANTAWEYWRGDAAQLHISADGEDYEELDDVRTYFVAGVDHVGGLVELKAAMPTANAPNPLDATLVRRALFVALERWVCDGQAPPPSTVPRVRDGTAVRRDVVLDALAGRMHLPDRHAMHAPHTVDLGPEAAAGIGRYPIALGPPAADYVSAVGTDGNELAGIRVPAHAAPVGTFTGFNPRRTVDGKPAVMLEFVGSFAPFDSAALDARYGDRAGYEHAARRVAFELVEQGFLLEVDVDRAVAEAVGLYDKTRGADKND